MPAIYRVSACSVRHANSDDELRVLAQLEIYHLRLLLQSNIKVMTIGIVFTLRLRSYFVLRYNASYFGQLESRRN